MRNGKAIGPDDIAAEAWQVPGRMGVEIPFGIFTKIMVSERVLGEWRSSTWIPTFMNKSDIQDCGNNRGIKLMSQPLKMWERRIEKD